MRKSKLLMLICLCLSLFEFTGCTYTVNNVNPQIQKITGVVEESELLHYVDSIKTVSVKQTESYADFDTFCNTVDVFKRKGNLVKKDRSLLWLTVADIAELKTEYTKQSDKYGNNTVTAIWDNGMYYKFDVDDTTLVMIRNDTEYYMGGENGPYNTVDAETVFEMLFMAWCNTLSYDILLLSDEIQQRTVEIGDAAYTFEYYALDERRNTEYVGYVFDATGTLCWRYANQQWYSVNECTANIPADISNVV